MGTIRIVDHPLMNEMWNQARNSIILNTLNYQSRFKSIKQTLSKEIFTIGSGILLWWNCTEGHEFQKKPANLKTNIENGEQFCPFCAGIKATLEDSVYKLLNNSLIPFWDWNRNQEAGKFPNELPIYSNKKAFIKCDIHGAFEEPRRIADITNAIKKAEEQGEAYIVCKKCSNFEVSGEYNLAVIRPRVVKYMSNPEMASTLLPYANKEIELHCEGIGCTTKPFVRKLKAVKDQYIFCDECSKKHQSSITQNLIYYFMKLALPNLRFRKKILGYEADMDEPELKLIIEVDGAYYHETDESVMFDIEKNHAFKDFTFIRIRDRKCPLLQQENYYLIEYSYNQSFNFIKVIIIELYEYILEKFYSEELQVRISSIEIDVEKSLKEIDLITKVVCDGRSVGFLYPGLIQRIDTQITDPFRITHGQRVEIPTICPNCNHTDHIEIKILVDKHGLCKNCQFKVKDITIEKSTMVRRHFRCKLKNSLALLDHKTATFYSSSNVTPVTEITSRSSTYKVEFYCPFCKDFYYSTVIKQSDNQCKCKICGLSAFDYFIAQQVKYSNIP